jgi:hypothetical protein
MINIRGRKEALNREDVTGLREEERRESGRERG